MDKQQALLEIAMFIAVSALAVGGAMLIRIARRRHLPRGLIHTALPTGVPKQPLPETHADRLRRHYLWSVALVLVLMLVGVLEVLLR